MPLNNTKELPPGTKFNRLTIIKLNHKDNRWRRHYLCKCDCGNEKVVQGSLMVSGNTKSCGCLVKEMGQSKRISKNHSEITAIILGYKRHAKDRDIKFMLTREDVINIIFNKCHYCGSDLSNNKITKNSINGGLHYNGIDRIDSHKDYTIDNVVPCCKICNLAKRDKSRDIFLTWINRVYMHQEAMADQWG